MGNQMSETSEKFAAEPGVRQKYHFDDTAGLGLPQPYNLHDDHVEVPSKYGQATTQNPKLQGQPFYVRDKGLLRLLHPYLSTTQKDHRAFQPRELTKYPKKDIATSWECENYPKAWGHGLKHKWWVAARYEKESIPREQLPMRDTTFFTTTTKVHRAPKAMVPVPLGGLKSLLQDSYVRPSDVKMKEAMFCPVDTPNTLPSFGMTTPRTVPGKVVLIFYGFFGCAGAILFFNLFLERIITFLAYLLRALHERKMRRKGAAMNNNNNPGQERRDSVSIDDEGLEDWKPSVYWVMLILLLGAIIVACCASAMYYPVEGWSYFDAIYFCFVTFATIGFGDYVVSQQEEYTNVHFYRLGNFVFIVLGCCCIYSLFNVTSIVIKQFLNFLLRHLNCECPARKPTRPTSRRNAITPGHLQGRGKCRSVTVDVENDSDSEGRRNSGEMISMRDFLQANKISLAMMQKQLWETSQRAQGTSNSSSAFTGGVGPLAILNRKLGQEEV